MLFHTGDGFFKAATMVDKALAVEKLPIGVPLFHEVRRRRSHRQDKWLFGFLKAAWERTRAQDQWESPEHLRAGAFVACGHRDTIEFTVEGEVTPLELVRLENFASSLVRQFLSRGEYVFVRRSPRGLAVDIPRSWSHAELGHEAATALAGKVEEWICSEVCPGATAAQIMDAAMEDAD